ncbi:MAG: hypothetical protein J6Y37_12645 [Paludibacteraceae bacterium]|nr:hypothetical protein [Paludibacteraceae bacterium]
MAKIVVRLVALLIGLSLGSVWAQDQKYKIDLYHYNAGEYVSLRWYPQTVDDYRRGALHGFVVQRRIVNGSKPQEWKELSRIIASSFDDFTKFLDDDDSDLGMIGFTLYQKEIKEKTLKLLQEGVEMPDSMDVDSYDSPLAQEYLYKFGLAACEFDWGVSKMAALCFKDETADRTSVYDYRVIFADGKDAEKSKILRVDMSQLSVLPSPTIFEGYEDDKRAYFSWDITQLENVYSGYQLERSSDGVVFQPVNPKPIIHMYTDDRFEHTCTYTSVLPECDKDYYFRMCGVSNFGFLGPYSKVVKLRCVTEYMVSVRIDTVVMNEKNEAELRWHVENPYNQEIKGLFVQRAEKMVLDSVTRKPVFNTLHKKPLSSKTRTYKDQDTRMSNYYRILAFGADTTQLSVSNVYFSHQIDSVPPAAPTGLKGTIDSLGVVRLEWLPNKEEDIMAYRVFFANRKDVDFIGCSDTFLKTPFYTDTLFLGSLTNEIYYKVMALDYNFNQSAMSEPVRLVKPDTIAPTKAVILDMSQDTTGTLLLKWANSASEDLDRVELYRSLNSNEQWTKLSEWKREAFVESYVDTFPFKGERVSYKIVNYDESSNSSVAESIPYKTKNVKQTCLKNLTYEVDYQKGGIRLKWEQCGCRVSKIYVYRSIQGKTKLLETILGSERIFFDGGLVKGDSVKYILQPVTEKQSKNLTTEEFVY